MDTYHLIIVICLIVITSFIFNVLSNKTNIPSVLMLITLGMVVKYFFDLSGFQQAFMPTLELLGVVGLIMIVLEAALDLKLSPERWPVIWKSTLVAFLTLNITTFGFAGMMMFVVQGLEFTVALLYSLPLAIISSAIVIPSVHKMTRTRREFMIYESTLSDIFGIMAFYILLENTNANGFWEIVGNVSLNLSLTVLISFIGSFILLYIFQKLVVIKTKFFLFLSLLILLYAEGKIFHLSSLLIILVFGLVLRNQFLFIRGKLSKYFDHQP
ncbi:cation:proton antiporter domain-containing protein [Prolixibacter bellariivorans]|uniref:cation:proton antiporter domain-containing protein n=1 Tax=Prolixibacter bellariivorans TaxID=314319 RepID=UPI0011DD7D58|nr:cation:proton antiporter [Prolixibacter bellariivorans]